MAVATGGRPRPPRSGAPAQGRAVEHVVVDKRRAVDELDGDRGADEPVGLRGWRAGGEETSSGRSRLPPAEIVSPA